MDYFARNNVDRKRWRKVRLTILDRDGYRCQLCGKAGKMEVDHSTPLEHGGDAYSPENLRCLCRGCHIEVTRQQEHWAQQSTGKKSIARFDYATSK